MTGAGAVLRDGWRMAVGTMTAVPVRPPSAVDRAVARVAMVVAPLAVLPVAVVGGAAGWAATSVNLPPLLTAGLVVGCFALGSRALHLDGLADTADGLTASYDRERALEIMRRGDIGPAGVATLVFVLLLQVAAGAALVGRPSGVLASVVLLCLGRCSLLITCARGVPAARAGGLGAVVAGVVPRVAGVLAGSAAAAAAAGVLALTGRPWWQGAAAVAVAAAVLVALTVRCFRRLGGITGDVLGAGVEVAACVLLVVAAAG